MPGLYGGDEFIHMSMFGASFFIGLAVLGYLEDKMTIYIVDLEAVDTRYTKEWKEHLPKQMRRATNQNVVTISGGDTSKQQRPVLLNFGGTNVR